MEILVPPTVVEVGILVMSFANPRSSVCGGVYIVNT